MGNHYGGALWESFEFRPESFIINSSNSSATRQQLFPVVPHDNQWHHVAGVWDGANLLAYVDGQLNAGPTTAPSSPWTTTHPLYIGARYSAEAPPVGSEMQGLVDELRIWTVARSQEQIQGTMHVALGPAYYATSDSGLFAYWRFDQLENLAFKAPGSDDLRDRSVNAGHAELVAGSLVPIPVSVPPLQDSAALGFAAFPNPSSGSATIRFTLATQARVHLEAYDLSGRRVRGIASGVRAAGDHSVRFDGRDESGRRLSAGQYYLRLTVGHRTNTVSVTLQP